ncbi:EAL domain-containing protein (putative c-di-GMP-specific phosphodiesterase class I)/CHASE2 domain-containing sensor protein [Sphingomonas jejuensis]|uniref:EAL domain-containing protein (Putative c-di-GMP-specific phosphodiesterase class I)/CHASE2 domain-containing sensor protein n=1 Tax=Sphingomonas jejuensis TaxID=904715 RepID=A0ABX0XPH2_9SPHN|nr:EAL domain-containing protein [Sphingomonas jejuensis]NJC35264.1 EAL domain-containing protein (putative c-di-GMP-specific phosphodiesterase class I)/CHASE2 domain-containing sensor protein [Sphingomonas jejuensis]
MISPASTTAPKRFDRKRRLRAVAVIVAIMAVLGGIGFAEPLEQGARMLRNIAARKAPSGDVVVIAIDDKSLAELGRWPWPRTHHATLLKMLENAEAGPVFFDIDMSSPSDPAEDRAFERGMAQAKLPVTIAGRFVIDPIRNVRLDVLPLPQFQRAAKVANINFWQSSGGSVWKLPYSMEMAGRRFQSFSAAAANRSTPARGEFMIDYSTDLTKVPTYSMSDVLGGHIALDSLRGKTILVGTASITLGDMSVAPGFGLVPGVYIHALGAETLRRGIPLNLGMLPALAAAVIAAAGMALVRRRRSLLLIMVPSILVLIGIPFLAEAHQIHLEVMPAIFLTLIVGGRFIWQDMRRSYAQGALVNPVSGLPNLEALRIEPVARESQIIVLRVLNFADITSSLAPEQEKLLVEGIAARMAMAGAMGPYQSDDGLFAMLHPDVDLSVLAERLDSIQTLFRSPVSVGETQIDLTLTLGVDRERGRPVANRLSAALAAAEQAASEGIDWKCHDPSQLEDSAWRLSMLSQLNAAIDAGDLWVAYQPKYDVATRMIVGAEALARWTHPDKGPIRPDIFIGAAEQSNRIEKLTLHVLEDAVTTTIAMRAHVPDFVMAVNLSAKLLESTRIVEQVRDILARHGLPASGLILELTETAALGSDSQSLSTLHALRGLGLGVAIDDYGTGMSTLDYLKRVPATEIKIDRSFVQSLDGQENDRLLVSSTIQLAHLLGLKVVAEGVERREALDILQRMGCDLAQGYLLSHPVAKQILLAKVDPTPLRSAA